MSRTIRTYNDLQLEKERLQSLLDAQKELIKLDFEGVKGSLKPASSVLSFVGSFGKKAATNPLVGMAVSLSTDLLLRKFMFKKAGWAVKTVLPFVVKKVTNNIVANPAKPTFLSKLVKKIT